MHQIPLFEIFPGDQGQCTGEGASNVERSDR